MTSSDRIKSDPLELRIIVGVSRDPFLASRMHLGSTERSRYCPGSVPALFDTGMVHGPERPACAFCGEPGATDVHREEDYPDAPCCADEEACHARVLAP